MAASPYRSTCTIDGTAFDAVQIDVVFETSKDRAGMPQMGSLKTNIRVLADFHDDKNLPNSTLSKLFDLAKVPTRDKIKDIKLEYWKDDAKQDALCSYKFKGWISRFQTANPTGGDGVIGNGNLSLNHMLLLDIEPVLNQQNFQDISFSN